jgi:hypothetical protein
MVMTSTFTIPNPKSTFIDPNTGLVSRDWFIYLSNLLLAVGNGFVGTTTQVLHGGGGGYGQVVLTQDVTGILAGANGGTGVNNGVKTVTLGGNFTLSGAFPSILNVSANTDIFLPTTGTVITGITLIGDVTGSVANSSTVTATITSNAVTNAQLAQMASRTIKGNNTASTANASDLSAGQFPATQTNDLASSGNIGEFVTSTVTSGAAKVLISTSVINVTSIQLTGGDWDVTGQVDYIAGGGAVIQYMQQGSNTVSGALPSQDAFSSIVLGASVVTDPGNPIPLNRISVSTTTTTFLVTKASFTIGTLSAYGSIRARRVR